MPTETVGFDEDDGPVSIEITAGYACLGTYQLLRRQDGAYVPFATDRPRRLDDDVPDCVVLPIPEEKLDGRWVFVRGNYAPAPEHEQVRVTYTFTQDGAAIHETTIEATPATEASHLRRAHRFLFQA